MNADLLEVKGALEKILDYLDNAPSDIAQNIEPNRKQLRWAKLFMERLQTLSDTYPALKPRIATFISKFKNYYNYFQPGFIADEGIDTIRDTLKNYCEIGISKINEIG